MGKTLGVNDQNVLFYGILNPLLTDMEVRLLKDLRPSHSLITYQAELDRLGRVSEQIRENRSLIDQYLSRN